VLDNGRIKSFPLLVWNYGNIHATEKIKGSGKNPLEYNGFFSSAGFMGPGFG
jgi:hypothetical protein